MVRAVLAFTARKGIRFDSAILHNLLAIEEMFFDILN